MAHYPKPFYKKARRLWYVEINRKQINLRPDKDEAFRRYHQLMMEPREGKVAMDSLAGSADAFLSWHKKNDPHPPIRITVIAWSCLFGNIPICERRM